jgi:signal transduction histidine kinase
VGGTVGWFHCTLGGLPGPAVSLLWPDFLLLTLGLLLVLGGWFREAADRRSFAHREHAHALAAELAQTNRELVRLGAEQQEFMTIAAHDLRAPLATVRGFAELLRDGKIAEATAQRQAHEEIQRQSARMLGLVTDYLDARHAGQAEWPVQLARLDLRGELRAAAQRHEVLAQQKQQEVVLAAGNAAVPVEADPALLAQVLDNFVTNAAKFSPAGATIRLRARPGADAARAEVQDEGPGVSPEDQRKLFRMFGRGAARPTGGESSHGLGLAVSRRLAEAMRGTVGCEPAPGGGAIFWIEFPAAPPPART